MLRGNETGQPEKDFVPLTILSIDHGAKRIGLAIKPAGQKMVLPLGIVPGDRGKDSLNFIRRVITERKADIVVVGLPLHHEDSQAREVKKFTRKLREGVHGVRWKFVDETLTSQGALDRMRDSGLEGTSRRPLDDHAAVLILEAFLQEQN